MEELLNKVVEKTGLPLDKAQGAIDAVMDFIKDKLPEPIAGQVSKLIEGGGDALGGVTDKLGDVAGGVTDKLGGMFGKKD
jgi:hypothetical protein